MKRLRPGGSGTLRIGLALLFAMASMLSLLRSDGVAAAQNRGLIDDTTYVSISSGEEITWTNDWAYDEESSTPEADGEVIALSSNLGAVLLSYFPLGIDKNSARDEILGTFADSADDFVQVDRGSYDNVSYSLDKANLSGTDLGIFTLFVERKSDIFVSLYLSPVELFDRGMKAAQADIEVAGAAVFQGIQPAGLQTALDNAGSAGTTKTTTTKTTRETPEPTEAPRTTTPRKPRETPTEVATEEAQPTRAPRVKTVEAPTDEPASEETPTPRSKKTGTTGGSDDYAELGVIADGEYESPQYGTGITWSDPWVINESADNPVLSDTKEGTDSIAFTRSDQEGPETFGSVSIRMFEAGDSDTPESIVEYWTSDEYLNGGAGDGSTVLLSDSTKQEGGVVLTSTLDNGTEIIQYLSVFFLDRGRTAVVIEFYATPDSVEESLGLAQDGITVDEGPILTLFDPTEITDALGG